MVNVGVLSIMNEHDLAIEFRAKTTEQLVHIVESVDRLEKKLTDWEETGCPFGKVNRARIDASADKGWLGKVLGLIVAVFSGIFGRKG